MSSVKIFPSLIAADLLNLEQEIKTLEPYCDGFHLDIMDNHFVPNLTFGHMFVNAIAQITKKTLFVHLMIENPAEFIKRLAMPPGTIVSFHPESTNNFNNVLNLINEKKYIPSIAISPKIELQSMQPYLNIVHHVLIMSVDPGFSGQTFLPNTISRLDKLMHYGKEHNLPFIFAADGGINKENISLLAQHGVTEFCIASAIFNFKDRVKAIKELYQEVYNLAP